MSVALYVVLALIVGYILYETFAAPIKEGFTVPRRADIGLMSDGWGEEAGWVRDLRYTESFTDVQGLGVASDFCRAVARKGDPASLQIACALGTRDGMDTLEYRSKTARDGFRFSRDDYWSARNNPKGRMDYCRILRDEETGAWASFCAVAGREGFKAAEVRDTDPPAPIRQLLEFYEGAMTWFRWQDDTVDSTGLAAIEVHGTPEVPLLLNPVKSRGLQLNRISPDGSKKEPHDYLRWGEQDTLSLDQAIPPNHIRAICFWIWWDGFEKGSMVVEARNQAKDRILLGIEGGGVEIPGFRTANPATEVSPQQALQQCIQIEPEPTPKLTNTKPSLTDSATYIFEIWDAEQRLMRLAGPMGSAKIGEWQHVAVTTTDATAWWPTWTMWINGIEVAKKVEGRLSPALQLTENYIGRNMRGCIQDFRIYRTPLTHEKLQASIAWSKPLLHQSP
jgi:hypothetical protein